jgi:hypothetical protein
LIPGRSDALRINGKATVVREAPFFEDMEVAGVRPILALVIDVKEVFLHHSRAFVRSGVWDSATWSPDVMSSEVELGRLLEEFDAS